ncbi:ACP S-malonyltransferase, partial [Xenorhabdus bovienii]|nr:ACP S-malonyltransferase [Xenorhabdus bovienii]
QASIVRLHRIREEAKQKIKDPRLNAEECHFLHQITQQWLDIIEMNGNHSLLMEKAKLQSLFDAVGS